MKINFNPTLDITTLATVMALIGQGAVLFRRVAVLEEGQRELRLRIESFQEKNNEAHNVLLQNAAKTAAVLEALPCQLNKH